MFKTIIFSGSGSNIRMPPNVARSVEMVDTGQSQVTRHNVSPTSRLKCGVWIFFALVTFFLAGAKYYFHGVSDIYYFIVQKNIKVEKVITFQKLCLKSLIFQKYKM